MQCLKYNTGWDSPPIQSSLNAGLENMTLPVLETVIKGLPCLILHSHHQPQL